MFLTKKENINGSICWRNLGDEFQGLNVGIIRNEK